MSLEIHSNSVQGPEKGENENKETREQKKEEKKKEFDPAIHLSFLQRGCCALALLAKGVNCPALRLAVFIRACLEQ